jgi:hypothetical protein
MEEYFNKEEWLEAVFADPYLRDGTKTRAVGLHFFADKFGFCYPNYEQIEQRIGKKSCKKTYIYLNELKKYGYIHVDKLDRGGYKKSNNYQLKFPKDQNEGN